MRGGPQEGAPKRLPSGLTQYRQPPSRERHSVFNLGAAAALALFVSFTLGAGRGALLVLDGEKVDAAMSVGTRWFIILMGIQVSYAILAFMVTILEPFILEWIRQPKQRRPRRERRMPPVVNTRASRRSRKTKEERREGALSGLGARMRATGDRLVQGRQPFNGGRFAQQAQVVEATMEVPRPRRQAVEDQALVDLFKMTNLMYNERLTRDSFIEMFRGEGNGTDYYNTYKRHWLRRNWVRLDGKGAMHWRYEEHQLYESDPFLKRVAERMGFQFPEEGTDVVGA